MNDGVTSFTYSRLRQTRYSKKYNNHSRKCYMGRPECMTITEERTTETLGKPSVSHSQSSSPKPTLDCPSEEPHEFGYLLQTAISMLISVQNHP